MLKMLDIPARELLRVKQATAVGLSKDMSEEKIIAGMAKHPIAIEARSRLPARRPRWAGRRKRCWMYCEHNL